MSSNPELQPTASPTTDFDPSKHLVFQPPTSVLTWTDLGYSKDHGLSPVAVSQPFPLFSTEAVHQMRREIFQSQVLEQHKVSHNLGLAQLRGYAEKHAPFTYAAWKHADTLAALSSVMGIELTIKLDYEIGHVNLSYEVADGVTVDWHRDSYPFACVLMLSDTADMFGGETVVRLADGGEMRVKLPQMGYATVIQGQFLDHKGSAAGPNRERITMVTSLWPRSPFVRDTSNLKRIAAISENTALYVQYAEYRLQMLEERLQAQLRALRQTRRDEEGLDIESFKAFLDEQEVHLHDTATHLVKESELRRGQLERSIGSSDLSV